MSSKKRTVITVETDQVLVIRLGQPTAQNGCHICPESAHMVPAGQAASLAQVTTQQIYYWVATGALHFDETVDGRLLVCLNSLLKLAADENIPQDDKEQRYGSCTVFSA